MSQAETEPKDTGINLSEFAKSVNISEISDDVGNAKELHPKDKARLIMAYVILGGVLFLCLLSGWALLCVPDARLARAEKLFEFVKGFGPPLVTLVLGFYFRDAVESGS